MYSPKNLNHVPSIRHGQTYESIALEKFSELTGKKVLKSGFCVRPDLDYLGASPDSFVQDESAVVEVKCPFVGRNCKITPGGKKFPFLEMIGDKISLKRTHNYYYQVVGQMYLSKKETAYFCVYTYKDFVYEKITLDEEFFKSTMLPKLKDFYNNVYCPYVASVLKQ